MFSLDDNYVVVNYHYIRDPSEDWKGIKPCSPKEFERQIEFLSQYFKVVSIPEIFKAAKNQQSGKFCSLAFDDCIRDIYTNAAPILKKYRLKATLFPISSTFEGRLPNAHKIHILLSKFSASKLIDTFNDYLGERHPQLKDQYRIPKDRRIEQKRAYDDLLTANFKEMLIRTPKQVREDFIDSSFKNFRLDEGELNREFFMTKEEIKKLYKEGMMVGCHSHNHFSYDTTDEETVREDVITNKKILSQLIEEIPRVFSYPHGRSNDSVVRVLRDQGFEYAVTTEKRAIKKSDSPFLIPRYDTNNIRDYLNKKSL